MAASKGDVRMACVDDFERFAEKSLPSSALGYAQGGADDEVTLRENVAAFKRSDIRTTSVSLYEISYEILKYPRVNVRRMAGFDLNIELTI